MQELSSTKAGRRFGQVVMRARLGERVPITVRGELVAAIVPAVDLLRLEQPVEAKARQDAAAGTEGNDR